MVPYNDAPIVLQRAREALNVAKQGLADARDPRRRLVGLRNAIVFGRSVTNIVENLRSRVERFDDWYKPLSDEMARDSLMKYLYKLRCEILKEGAMPVSGYARINTISSDDIARFPKPPNPKKFFMGDEWGGAGWEVEVAPGVIEKYYIELPAQFGSVGLTFLNSPHPQEDALDLCARYLGHMERIVNAAEERWGGKKK